MSCSLFSLLLCTTLFVRTLVNAGTATLSLGPASDYQVTATASDVSPSKSEILVIAPTPSSGIDVYITQERLESVRRVIEVNCTVLNSPECLSSLSEAFDDADDRALEKRFIVTVAAFTVAEAASILLATARVLVKVLPVMFGYLVHTDSRIGPHLRLPPGDLHQIANWTSYPDVINIATATNDANPATITIPPQLQT
ncbi:hypothetical protein LTS18_013477 [Coniosporium uncinatum]|uniref:Uncharacterized protein n=1 Tax=Coniosporium uncinatum TaxID=93489 RepID=A0ACC3DVC0_9PEZI|nr:hypothetical protein LTS18_013477 [Coniosporium uncinatum]